MTDQGNDIREPGAAPGTVAADVDRWVVESRVGWPTACGDAQTEGVIRLVHHIRRGPDLDAATFGARLLDDHGPLLASLRLALGIVRATIAVRTGDPADERMAQVRGGMEEPYDAVIWSSIPTSAMQRCGVIAVRPDRVRWRRGEVVARSKTRPVSSISNAPRSGSASSI